ncbi:MAG: transcriptional regulator [Caulobacter sp. 12-67-6]|nr:MAG: transcriptional regulator [Caulobacter sp. 12-67-6]OYX73044.1 MAG: transcriptional regulator [Caulobacter sp. 32-67-35]OZA70998.1 MAG: transcriptional regulator [Caulobacter sp. 39-67-4]HQR87774.1 helix-turn-helix transcriptional regulator [Caulobacter sp.]
MEMTSAVASLSALAHGGRLSAFRMLVQAGAAGLPAGEIARCLKMLPNSLSSHLAILDKAGLIHARREGRSIIYTADYGAMQELLGFLLEDCCGGAPEICAPLGEIFARAVACHGTCLPELETA